MQVWRKNLPWRSLPTNCNIFSSYLSCFSLFVDTSWFKINDGSPPPTNATCTIYSNVTSTCQVFAIILILMNSRRGWHGQKKNQDEGLALVAKTCPHRPKAIEKAKNGQAFPLEKKLIFHFFPKEATAGTPRDVCNVSRKHSNIWPADVQH